MLYAIVKPNSNEPVEATASISEENSWGVFLMLCGAIPKIDRDAITGKKFPDAIKCLKKRNYRCVRVQLTIKKREEHEVLLNPKTER